MNEKKNILMMLSDNSYPPDIRVEKEVKSLIQAGNSIFLLANRRPNEIPLEKHDQFEIIRKKFIFSGPIGAFLYYFLFFRICIFLWIILFSKKKQIDVIHVHDLPFYVATWIATMILGIPVIYDMHESYPTLIKTAAKNKNLIYKIANSIRYFIYSIEFRFAIKTANKVIVISPEMKKEIEKKRKSKEDIIVISNTLDLEKLDNINIKSIDKDQAKVYISYIGGLAYHRGISDIVSAINILPKNVQQKIRFEIIGDGSEKKPLEKLVKEKHLENFVFLRGFYPFEKAMRVIAESDVCVIPYIKNKQTNHAIPHKIFQYMYYGKPLLVSDVASLVKIVSDSQSGLIYKSGDIKDAAKKIQELVLNPAKRINMGNDAKKAVVSQYNWNIDGSRLVNLYSHI